MAEGERITLRQARARSVLSVRELADRAGVAPATVYQVEHQRTRPHPRTIRRLSQALGVEAMEVVEFAEAIAERGAAPKGHGDQRKTQSRRNS